MSDSVRPHRQQPTKLPFPWDSPGKNTGVGCHFLLQCMKVKSEIKVAHSCQTLLDPMDHSLPRSSIHGILQARILEWVAIFLLSTPLSTFSKFENKIRRILGIWVSSENTRKCLSQILKLLVKPYERKLWCNHMRSKKQQYVGTGKNL